MILSQKKYRVNSLRSEFARYDCKQCQRNKFCIDRMRIFDLKSIIRLKQDQFLPLKTAIIKMYIIKLKNANDDPQLHQIRSASLSTKKQKTKAEYSDSFQKLMNKVLNKIYCQNNFTSKRKNIFLTNTVNQKTNHSFFQSTFKPFTPRRCSTTTDDNSVFQTHKTSLSHISKSQNQSKSSDLKNKSSISFVNNRQYLKGIRIKKQQYKQFQKTSLKKSIKLQATQTTYFQNRYSNRSKRNIELQNFISDRGQSHNQSINKYGLGIQKLDSIKFKNNSKIRMQKQTKKQKNYVKNFIPQKQTYENFKQQDDITFEPWDSSYIALDHEKIFFFKSQKRT